MESYEILKEAVDAVGAKKVAADLKVSTSLVYKWCAPPPAEPGDDASGARNPLDRVLELSASTGSQAPVEWLAAQAGGFLVENPDVASQSLDAEYVARTQAIIQEFSDLLRVLSRSMTDDGRVDQNEAQRIRRVWQRLKQQGESFVTACEQGLFDNQTS